MKLLRLAVLSLLVGGFSLSALAKDNTDAIYEKNYGEEWAFIFDRGVLICYPGKALFIEDVKTKTLYPLNGVASMAMAKKTIEASPLEPVWKDDANYPGLDMKMSMDIFIDAGLKLCD